MLTHNINSTSGSNGLMQRIIVAIVERRRQRPDGRPLSLNFLDGRTPWNQAAPSHKGRSLAYALMANATAASRLFFASACLWS